MTVTAGTDSLAGLRFCGPLTPIRFHYSLPPARGAAPAANKDEIIARNKAALEARKQVGTCALFARLDAHVPRHDDMRGANTLS